jgi:hypothetical protein
VCRIPREGRNLSPGASEGMKVAFRFGTLLLACRASEGGCGVQPEKSSVLQAAPGQGSLGLKGHALGLPLCVSGSESTAVAMRAS